MEIRLFLRSRSRTSPALAPQAANPQPTQAHDVKRHSDFQVLSAASSHFSPSFDRVLQAKQTNLILAKLIQIGSDVLALVLALLLSSLFSAQVAALIGMPWAVESGLQGLTDTKRLVVLVAVCVTAIGWFWAVLHHYTVRRPFWDEVREVAVVVVAAFFADATVAFLSGQDVSRLSLVSYWGSVLVLLLALRYLTKTFLIRLDLFSQPCIFLGQGSEIKEALLAFASEPLMGFKPIALVHPVSANSEYGGYVSSIYQIGYELGLPVYALTAQVRQSLNSSKAKLVFVMGGADQQLEEELNRLRQLLSLAREDVYLVPPLMGLPLHGMQSFNFFSHEVLLLRATSKLKNRSSRFLKRAFDVVASTSALLILSPLLLYVAWRIRKESLGSAFFKQRRIGLNGKEFEIYKFRSMVVNAERILQEWRAVDAELWREYVRNNFKLVNDPRITSIGRLIRRTSIDELPQLINVLKGDMSLVGPRPLLTSELGAYGSSIDVYTNVRPGISGLWQISGRSTTTFDTRIALDRWYIRNWSFWHDIVILFKTVKVVFRSEGAY